MMICYEIVAAAADGGFVAKSNGDNARDDKQTTVD